LRITKLPPSILIAFPFIKEGQNPQHGFSNIRFVDLDDDNDQDLFFGDLFNPSLYYFNNLGDPAVSDLTLQTQTFMSELSSGFNHTAFGDLDNDGISDIAVGVFWDDDGGNNKGAVWILFLNANGTVKDQQKISDMG